MGKGRRRKRRRQGTWFSDSVSNVKPVKSKKKNGRMECKERKGKRKTNRK